MEEIKTAGVGDGIRAKNARWSFGGNVPASFDDHVSKSVPRYADGHDLVVEVSDFFVKEDSICYELGCSTGALIRKLAARHRPSVKWVGLDVESAMIEQAQKVTAENHSDLKNIEFAVGDINSWPYDKTDFIVAYYVVQFVPPRLRQELLSKVYESLNWGGAFLMFEKVRGADARFQDILTTMYIDYKLKQGYDAEQIVHKTRSLKGVLEPFSTAGNLDLLRRAGFVDVMSIFKHICFEGFLCIK